MEIMIEEFIEILPFVFICGAVYYARRADDTLEKIKYILWAILFQMIPIVSYVI